MTGFSKKNTGTSSFAETCVQMYLDNLIAITKGHASLGAPGGSTRKLGNTKASLRTEENCETVESACDTKSCTYVHTCLHTYVCMYVCVCMYECMYECMNV